MSNTNTLTGPIKVIFPTQTFPSGFSKREFVVTIEADSKYPQDIKLELVKDKCDLLDALQEGEEVTVAYDLRGNEYNGKYYVSLAAWKIESEGEPNSQQRQQPAAQRAASRAPAPAAASQELDSDEDDDLPF